MDANGVWYSLMQSSDRRPQPVAKDTASADSTRILVIGAGARGRQYSDSIARSTSAVVAAVAEPIDHKRNALGRACIWRDAAPKSHESFASWQAFVAYETDRRRRAAANDANVPLGVDAVFVCTLDEHHAEVVRALAPLGLHVMCEKPLATTLDDCLSMWAALAPPSTAAGDPPAPLRTVFSVGHVLRYSPHNMLLRRLVVDERAVGDVLGVEHTEPVGFWHYAHSYVRGNWRTEERSAPSLLTKSCHDVDLLLWLLCSPGAGGEGEGLPAHLPSRISSSGRLNHFRKARKPVRAGDATNCLSCAMESDCAFSAKKIYAEMFLREGQTGWPVSVVNSEIEDLYRDQGAAVAEQRLLETLAEDYDASTPAEKVVSRNWFGRCVWESDNDVCDDQTVTLVWDDAPELEVGTERKRPLAKTATMHMIAQTEAKCERRGRIYGTRGEVSYDSSTIGVFDFKTGQSRSYNPEQMPGGHGGGDDGLVRQFVKAVQAVQRGDMDASKAQARFVGCDIEDVVRSHAAVFAAEEARREGKVVMWDEWWAQNVLARLRSMQSGDWELVS